MMISQTAEYALRAVVWLASQPDRALGTRQIAEAGDGLGVARSDHQALLAVRERDEPPVDLIGGKSLLYSEIELTQNKFVFF